MNSDRLKFRIFYNGDYSITPYCTIDMNGKVWLDASIMRVDGLDDPDTDIIDITDKCTVEMSTGLRDKNSNLIYEGDIVKIGNGSINGGVIVEDLVVKMICEIGRYNLPTWTSDVPDWSHYVEIIGNVHEQAEQKDK